MSNMIEVLKMMKTHINGRNDNPNIPAPGFHPTKAPGRQLTNHAPEPGQVSPDEYSKFDKYLVPEQLERKTYRFENDHGAIVWYFLTTDSYDVSALTWIGNQYIYVNDLSKCSMNKHEVDEVLREIKNRKDD